MGHTYVYSDDEPRYYPELGVEADKGTEATFDRAPDDRWHVKKTKKTVAKKAAAPIEPEPAPEEPKAEEPA